MFESVGWGEIVVLGLAALFIFGPERLPDLAKDAADGLKRVRRAMTGARGQLRDTLGPDFAHLEDVDLRRYHPRSMLRRALLDGDDDPAGDPDEPVTHLAAARAQVAGATRPRPGDDAP